MLDAFRGSGEILAEQGLDEREANLPLVGIFVNVLRVAYPYLVPRHPRLLDPRRGRRQLVLLNLWGFVCRGLDWRARVLADPRNGEPL